ncbi:MAG: DUF2829 domain-containing protein [Solibacillus sp.]|uniref:DUF2829 domain-containing protein n=1 Tax=Solibacillus sp. TaxID=1909654 RepID=UPI00331550BF
MTFEEILPRLKIGEKIIRKGWGSAELYVKYVPATILDGLDMNPYFVINVTGEGYTMFTPTVCDILADDWEIVL